ncbi:hypothetical protein CHS0354_005663 [Potamilus streckersoni]|uniref:Uncharacterized protein n=1 Tax=Potamilus streckersoni TaxID=2493646 RepID=A0AAE0VM57_9BIVA|nr:hypothetical protein CHS0354_005663 [Potamilus streckersoni]
MTLRSKEIKLMLRTLKQHCVEYDYEMSAWFSFKRRSDDHNKGAIGNEGRAANHEYEEWIRVLDRAGNREKQKQLGTR